MCIKPQVDFLLRTYRSSSSTCWKPEYPEVQFKTQRALCKTRIEKGNVKALRNSTKQCATTKSNFSEKNL